MVFVLPEGEAESFYKKHARAVYRLTLSIVKEPGEAEDVLQTVFMKALTYEGSLSRIQNPRAWLATVAKNTALNHLRSKGREMPSEKLPDTDTVWNSLEDKLIGKEETEKVLACLNREERLILMLHYVDGYTFKEIAALFHQPLGTVQSTGHRAKQKVRKTLKDSVVKE